MICSFTENVFIETDGSARKNVVWEDVFGHKMRPRPTAKCGILPILTLAKEGTQSSREEGGMGQLSEPSSMAGMRCL